MPQTNNSYWLRSGITNVLQNFSGVFFGFASFYILVRILSKNDFGTWSLFLTVTTIQEIIRSSIVQNALIKFISSNPSESSKIVSSSFIISSCMTVICILFNLIFGSYLGDLFNSTSFASMLMLYNISFLFTGLLTQFNCIEQANLSFNGVFWSNFVRQVSFFLLLLVLNFFKKNIDLIQLVYIQIVGSALSTIIAYRLSKKYLKFNYTLDINWIKKIFNYGKYSFGTSVSSILSSSIDQMMLGSLLSPKATGSYNIAVRITNLIEIPTNAVAVSVFPQSAKRSNDGKEAIKYLYEKSVGTLLAILIPLVILLYLFSGLVIEIIAGEKYVDSVPLLNITLLYCLFVPFGRQFGTILDSIGRTKTTFFVVIFTAILNIILNLVLIKKIGVMGAAYATLISHIIGFIIAQILLKMILNVNILNTFSYAIKFYPDLYQKYFKQQN